MKTLILLIIQIFISISIFTNAGNTAIYKNLAPDTAKQREAMQKAMKARATALAARENAGTPAPLTPAIKIVQGPAINLTDIEGTTIDITNPDTEEKEQYTYDKNKTALIREAINSDIFKEALKKEAKIKWTDIASIDVSFLNSGAEKAIFKIEITLNTEKKFTIKLAHLLPMAYQNVPFILTELKKEFGMVINTNDLFSKNVTLTKNIFEETIVPYWNYLKIDNESFIIGPFAEGETLTQTLLTIFPGPNYRDSLLSIDKIFKKLSQENRQKFKDYMEQYVALYARIASKKDLREDHSEKIEIDSGTLTIEDMHHGNVLTTPKGMKVIDFPLDGLPGEPYLRRNMESTFKSMLKSLLSLNSNADKNLTEHKKQYLFLCKELNVFKVYFDTLINSLLEREDLEKKNINKYLETIYQHLETIASDKTNPLYDFKLLDAFIAARAARAVRAKELQPQKVAALLPARTDKAKAQAAIVSSDQGISGFRDAYNSSTIPDKGKDISAEFVTKITGFDAYKNMGRTIEFELRDGYVVSSNTVTPDKIIISLDPDFWKLLDNDLRELVLKYEIYQAYLRVTNPGLYEPGTTEADDVEKRIVDPKLRAIEGMGLLFLAKQTEKLGSLREAYEAYTTLVLGEKLDAENTAQEKNITALMAILDILNKPETQASIEGTNTWEQIQSKTIGPKGETFDSLVGNLIRSA